MKLSSSQWLVCAFLGLIISSGGTPTDSVSQTDALPHSTNGVSPATLEGLLMMPSDGAKFVNQGGAMGDIQIVYQVPKAFSTTNIGERTLAIDVVLVPRREQGFNPGPAPIVLARGLRPRSGTINEKIQTNFVPPVSACGDYRLMVTENQIFQNAILQVSAGAPTVSVACSPIDSF